jgi:hypothetical protein
MCEAFADSNSAFANEQGQSYEAVQLCPGCDPKAMANEKPELHNRRKKKMLPRG